VAWSLRIDTLTAVMLVVVNTVSALVHLYSIGYMHDDPARSRFFAYLSLFTFAMLMLVTSDNLLQMFFGWEGVGLASYLLIGFWYKKPSANAAAMKAFIVNRVGDFGFALGIFGCFAVFQSIQFDTIFAAAPDMVGKTMEFAGYQIDTLTLLALLLFMGAMGKSAQFLLHTWLPDAMEGPTPVSALIHAATMVTAGVFHGRADVASVRVRAGRFDLRYGDRCDHGAVRGNGRPRPERHQARHRLFDVLAARLHVRCLRHRRVWRRDFPSVHARVLQGAAVPWRRLGHPRDAPRAGHAEHGRACQEDPITWAMMLIGTLALTGVGIPHVAGFAGFYSKDAIIEGAFAAHTPANYAFWVLTFAAFLTSFYSWRLMFMTFHGQTRAEPDTFKHAHESPYVMLVPLFVLAVGAVIAGAVFYGAFIGKEYKAFWGGSLFEGPNNHIIHDMHEIPEWVYWAPFAAMLSGLALAYLYYIRVPSLPAKTAHAFAPIYLFFLNKWYFDELYDFLFVKPAVWIGRVLWKTGDGRIIDGLGPDGISARVMDVTGRVVKLQTGYVYHYAFAMLIGVAAMTVYFMFAGGALK
jgi:NADH-quinone oxidoreductase subunit L